MAEIDWAGAICQDLQEGRGVTDGKHRNRLQAADVNKDDFNR